MLFGRLIEFGRSIGVVCSMQADFEVKRIDHYTSHIDRKSAHQQGWPKRARSRACATCLTAIHRRGSRNKPLAAREEAANKTRSKVRARVEHVFGNQQGSMGGKLVRTIGIVRAAVKIGMQNLAYNMRRLVVLERIAVAAG